MAALQESWLKMKMDSSTKIFAKIFSSQSFNLIYNVTSDYASPGFAGLGCMAHWRFWRFLAFWRVWQLFGDFFGSF